MNGNQSLRFEQKLVLNSWVLRHFGANALEDLAKRLRDERFEGFTPENRTRYYDELNRELFEFEELGGSAFLTADRLLRYDANIVHHWKDITRKRNRLGHEILPTYFQYLSLLFTEIYLEYYFTDRDTLLEELNDEVREYNRNVSRGDELPDYIPDDLNKLAFWSATGSGKTLLMHVHLLQFRWYHRHYAGSDDGVDNIILITPDERMTEQHLKELELSGIQAARFSGHSYALFKGSGIPETVEVLDIHKLQEEEGVKTFAVESFEGSNLVFIDEGHRGFSAGSEGAFLSRRDTLCSNGFSFEYSATFGQAVANNRKDLESAYARNILFDYSYHFFYKDGYGKDFRILNMEKTTYTHQLQEYMVAGLVSFYQQLRYYNEHELELDPFLFAKPLWIFVGSSVIKKSVADLSDVARIIRFINQFIHNKENQTIIILRKLLADELGLHDRNGKSVFSDSFPYITSLYGADGANALFRDIKKDIFHAESGSLHIERVTGSGDEILLRLGTSDTPFGIITVGEPNELCKHIDESEDLPNSEDREFSGSYFPDVDKKDSPIHLLIGAKKFIEGWSSWRVASMGLMNIGKKQGTQIIQLFGRGVRLKGYDFRLKRSERLEKLRIQNIPIPKHIGILETLSIFGIEAHYMDRFREILEEEGVLDSDFDIVEIPIRKQHVDQYARLQVVDVDAKANFRRDGKPFLFEKMDHKNPAKVVVHWSTALEVMSSKKKQDGTKAALSDNHFTDRYLPFLNIDELHRELVDYKNERGFFHLTIPRQSIIDLLKDTSWYAVHSEKDLLHFDSVEKIPVWNEIAASALKKYMDQVYYTRQSEYENSYLTYRPITADDPNLAREKYEIYLPRATTPDSVKARLEELQKIVEQGWGQSDATFDQHAFSALCFDRHLYFPLIHLPYSKHLSSRPVGLNDGEWTFARNLERYYRENPRRFNGAELFLLRNESRGRGFGFFLEAGFFPDFIMWLITKDRQHLVFIDPKGIQNLGGLEHPKLRFFQEIKTIEEKLGKADIRLESFIVSVTPYEDITWNNNSEAPHPPREFERRHVLFQKTSELGYIGKMFDKVIDDK